MKECKRKKHDWHIITCFTDYMIKRMATYPRYSGAQSLDQGPDTFKEKICLKCGKYVDEITPQYEHHLRQIKVERSEQARIDALVREARGGEEKVWER